MADNHINEAEREVIERAIRFIENESHTYIARDTMANELRKLAARRTPVADGAALRWKFNGIAGLKPYLTDKQYQAQTPGTKKWYDPICDRCGPDDGAALDLPPQFVPAGENLRIHDFSTLLTNCLITSGARRNDACNALMTAIKSEIEETKREAISHYLRKQAGKVGACRYPLCQSEAEQDRIAAEIYRQLYTGQEGEQPTINKGESA